VTDEMQVPKRPPWNWKALPEAQRDEELEDLAEWVADLQEAYGRWVRLPNCWPLHRALREELAVFWYWRQWTDGSLEATAEEAARWHQSLRASAQVWSEAFGGCTHRSLGEVDERRDDRSARLAAARPYVETLLVRRGDQQPSVMRPFRARRDEDRDGRDTE